MEATIEATRVLEDLTEIVVRHIGALDTSSFTYARFAMHVRFLLDRIKLGRTRMPALERCFPL